MNQWLELAKQLRQFFEALQIEGFSPSEAMNITSVLARSMISEALRASSEGLK
jgi:hypothetical protein